MDQICDDLKAEHAALDAIVATISEEIWHTATPAEGWDVKDTIVHLIQADMAASLAVADAEGFADTKAKMAQGGGLELFASAQGKTGAETLALWRSEREKMLAAFRSRAPKDRIPWFGPDMSTLSFATARLMETWSHGQDVADTVGAPWPATDRVKTRLPHRRHDPRVELREPRYDRAGRRCSGRAHRTIGRDVDLGPRSCRRPLDRLGRRVCARRNPTSPAVEHVARDNRSARHRVAQHRSGFRRPSHAAGQALTVAVAEPPSFEPPSFEPPTFGPPTFEPPAPSWEPPPTTQPPAPKPAFTPPPISANQPPNPSPGQPAPSQPSLGQPPWPNAAQPQPGPPPPSWSNEPVACWPTAAPPPPRSRRKLVLGLLAVFVVVVLAIGGCVAWFIGTVTAPVDVSNDFFSAVDRDAFSDAAALTHPDCGPGLTAEELRQQFAGVDIAVDLNSSSIANGEATVRGSIDIAGEGLDIEIWLRKLNDEWRVCGFRS